MGHTAISVVPSHDVAARVNPQGSGKSSAREINRGEFAPAQQIAMGDTGTHVESHDVAAGVDPVGFGKSSAGEINRSEGRVFCRLPTRNQHDNGENTRRTVEKSV